MLNLNSLKYLRSFSLNYCATNLIYFKSHFENFSLKLYLLDDISRRICMTFDHLSLINLIIQNKPQLSENKQIFNELNNSMNLINDYMHELNSDNILYNHLLYMKYHENSQFLNQYEWDFLNNIIKDYEDKYFILSINEKKWKKIKQMTNEEEMLKVKFEENINKNKEKIEINEKYLEIIKKNISSQQENIQIYKSNNGFSIELHFKKILGLIKKINDSSLNRQLFQEYFDSNKNNKIILSHLLKVRSMYVNLISSKESYSQFILRNSSMIGSFIPINDLISLLSLEAIKINRKINDEFLIKNENGKKFNIFDLFGKILRTDNYFDIMISLKEAIEFVIKIFDNYCSIKIQWYFSQDSNFPQVKNIHFEIYDSHENEVLPKALGEIDIIISDSHITQTMISRPNYKFSPFGSFKSKPKFYLVFDFFKDSHQLQEISLNFNQIRNFTHELAHAIHNIFSYHDFQYISSNSRLDYAEFIAILFENLFIYEYLKLNKCNYEIMKEFFFRQNIEKLEQIYFSLIDLKFHNEIDFYCKTPEEIGKTIEKLNSQLFSEIFGEYDMNELMTSNYYYCSMHHLNNYASLYYSYSLAYILTDEFMEKIEKQVSREKIRESFNKILTSGHKSNVFYLILKEIF